MRNFLLSIFLFSGIVAFGQEWKLAGSLDGDADVRHHPVTFSLDGFGYVGLGTTSFGHLDDFWRFDPSDNSWEFIGFFPGGSRGFSIGTTYNGKAYVGFGRNADPLKDLWEYDPSTNTWTELESCPCDARTHPALVAANGHIYVGLGSGGGNKNDWWAYNIENGVWEQRADFPSFRRHHPYHFEIDEYAYVGMGHGDAGIYNDLYKYDHLNDTWETLANLPGEGRVAGTQFSFNGRGYVLSGDGEDHMHMEDGEFWEYDPNLDLWNQLPSHPGNGSRWAPGSFMIDNTLYFLAGLEAGILRKDMMTYSFEDFTSSIQVEDIQQLDVFPNPTQHFVELNQNIENSQVSIFSFEGKRMFDFKTNDRRIDVSSFNPGLYILQINSDGETYQSKIVKQ